MAPPKPDPYVPDQLSNGRNKGVLKVSLDDIGDIVDGNIVSVNDSIAEIWPGTIRKSHIPAVRDDRVAEVN